MQMKSCCVTQRFSTVVRLPSGLTEEEDSVARHDLTFVLYLFHGRVDSKTLDCSSSSMVYNLERGDQQAFFRILCSCGPSNLLIGTARSQPGR